MQISSIFSVYYFCVSLSVIGTTNARLLRGLLRRLSSPPRISYDEYQRHLLENAKKNGPVPLHGSRRFLASNVTTIVPQFPEGVFDISKVKDVEYMRGLSSRCANAENVQNPAEVLACHLYYDMTLSEVPMALGTLSLDTNLLDATNNGLYPSNKINNIFEDYALAVMIEERCFLFDISENSQKEENLSYSDEQSYSNTLKNDNILNVDSKLGFGPFSVTQGYNTQKNMTNHTAGKFKVAYGEHKFSAPIGTLVNLCLQSKKDFESVIGEHQLIKPGILKIWKIMIDATDSNELAKTDDFQQLVRGGLVIPSLYQYGAAVSYKINSVYKNENSTSKEIMEKVIKAGVNMKFSKIDTGSGINTEVTDAVGDSAEKAGIKQESTVTTEAYGRNMNTNCFKNQKDNSCPKLLMIQVKHIREDFNKIGRPFQHGSFVSLNDIVGYYTKSDGLGKVFDDALTQAYSYGMCKSPGESKRYSLFNGKGEVVMVDDCKGTNGCTTFFSYNDANNKPTVCKDANKYECAKDGNDSYMYRFGKNKWKSLDSTEFGYCDANFVCNSDKQVYDFDELCSPAYYCSGANTVVGGDGSITKKCSNIEYCDTELDGTTDLNEFCVVDEWKKSKLSNGRN